MAIKLASSLLALNIPSNKLLKTDANGNITEAVAGTDYLVTVPSHTHDASNITSGTFSTSRIPNLAASKITSGTFADARISSSSVTQHEADLTIHTLSGSTNDVITINSTLQVEQGSEDAIISFEQDSVEIGKFDQDGYLYATGFKASGTTGFLKSDGSIDTSTYASSSHNHNSLYVAIAGGYYDSDFTWDGTHDFQNVIKVSGASATTTNTTALFYGTGGLVEKRTLGSAAFSATSDFATAAQGALADSALQSLPTHNHDARYYTKTQSDTKYLTKGDSFIPISMTASDYEASAEEVVLSATNSYRGLAFPNGAKDFEFEVSIKGGTGANHQGIFWGATDLTSLLGAGLTGYKTTHQNADNLHIRDIANNSNQMTINPEFAPDDGQYHRYRLVQYRNSETDSAILKVYLDGNLIFDTDHGGYNNPPQQPTYFGFIVHTGDVKYAHWNVRDITDSEDLIRTIGEDVFQPIGNYLTSLPAHHHDARYYTETEMDGFLSGKLSTSGGSLSGGLTINEGNLRIVQDVSNIAQITLGEDPTGNHVILEYDGTGSGATNYFYLYSGLESVGWAAKGTSLNMQPSTGKIAIGTTTFTEKFNVNGNVRFTGTISASGYNKTNWDTAFGWGNHSGKYMLLGGDGGDFGAVIDSIEENVTLSFATYDNAPYPNVNIVNNFVSHYSGRRAQFWHGDTPEGGVWWRGRQGDTVGWHPWQKLWTSADFNPSSFLTSYTETDTLATVVARGQETAQALVVTAVDSGNPAAAANSARLSGYGLLGNRGTFYLTNGGGVVQIGKGSVHNEDPVATFGNSIVHHHPTVMEAALTVDQMEFELGNYQGLRYKDGTDLKFKIGHNKPDNRFYIYNYNTSASALTVSGNNNIGIGTEDPQAKLNIEVGSGGTNGKVGLRIGATNNYPSLELGTYGAYGGMVKSYGNDIHYFAGHWNTIGQNATEDHSHYWYTSRASTADWSEVKMELNHNGDLIIPNGGIRTAGATTFDSTVHLNGAVNFNGVNGQNFTVNTDGDRIIWDFQRNGTRRMSFYHEADQETFNFSFQSGNNLQINGNRILTTADEGSGNGIDADTVDGLQAGSFLRSDADDSFSGNLTTAQSKWIKFYHPTQTDTNDGKIGAGVFDTGLNIVGVQTTAGTGRQVRVWGDLITSTGTKYATESYVTTAVSNLVDSAPGTLDTLNELAAALGDDANFSTTVTNSIATKLSKSGGQIYRNGTLNIEPGSYSYANGASLELYTTDNHVPSIGFHRGSVSATTLWEEQGELFITKWNGDGTPYKLWHTGDFDPGNLGYADGSTYQTYGTGNNGWLMPDYNNNASNFMRMYYDDGSREFRMYSYHGAAGESKIALYNGSSFNTLSSNNIAEFKTAYGWGNHASAGYLTSISSANVTAALGYTPPNPSSDNIINSPYGKTLWRDDSYDKTLISQGWASGYGDFLRFRAGGSGTDRLWYLSENGFWNGGIRMINTAYEISSANILPIQDRTYDIGRDDLRWRIVFCEVLDSAGLHEKNLQNPEGEKSVGDYATGTVLVWKGGKNVPCTESADHMRMGIAVKGVSSPLVQGAEPVLCTGEVNEGDYLVTSSVEGHAAAISPQYMRQHNLFDCVLGKALEGGNGDSHIIKTWVNI